jgi:hypothetical protein
MIREGKWYVWFRAEIHTAICTESLGKRGHLEDQSIDVRIMLKKIFSI